MIWDKKKIENHIKAARLLEAIKNKAFKLIKNNNNISEYEVHKFILDQFKKNNLKTDRANCIVAFKQNTSFVHYYPSQYCRRLILDSLIMIDLWARLKEKNAPYADITWMAYYGRKIPNEIIKVFNIVKLARDKTIKYIINDLIKGNIPTGKEVDKIARIYINDKGYGDFFLHTTGHSLGIEGAHGKEAGIGLKNQKQLIKNLGYTIEPGIYLKNKFGVRSEIDFYINNNNKLVLTSNIQKNITLIKV